MYKSTPLLSIFSRVSKTRFEIARVSDSWRHYHNYLVTNQVNVICIFIDPRILNKARVAYIQAIFKAFRKKIKEKTFTFVILLIKDEF